MAVSPIHAAHCRPERLAAGELLCIAESTAWATQLRLMTPQVLARIAALSAEQTGQQLIDDEVLAEAGITDLSPYQYGDGSELRPDIFLD